LAIKQKRIPSYDADAYIAISHAFLKSYYHLANEFFPKLKLIHLIRNPLYTEKSEANRE